MVIELHDGKRRPQRCVHATVVGERRSGDESVQRSWISLETALASRNTETDSRRIEEWAGRPSRGRPEPNRSSSPDQGSQAEAWKTFQDRQKEQNPAFTAADLSLEHERDV